MCSVQRIGRGLLRPFVPAESMKNAAILLNGCRPAGNLLRELEGRTLLCADGAYLWVREAGLEPDILIGDFDSLEICDFTGPRLTFREEKDETDGELCLRYAAEHGCRDLVILGGEGGREDHFQANLILLVQALKKGISARMLTASCDIFAADGSFRLQGFRGQTISLVPFTEQVHIMNTEGLKYALHDAVLRSDSTLGISNQATASEISVELDSGILLVYSVREMQVKLHLKSQ